MSHIEQEGRDIAAGQRVKQLLDDDAVGGPNGALSRMERQYYEEFKKSSTSEERVRAWAKANVLDDFVKEMHVIMQTGQAASIERAAREKRADATKK